MTKVVKIDEVRLNTLAALEETRAKLNSWRFLKALKSADEEDRARAGRAMLDVAMARQVLAGAILADIEDELAEEQHELKLATAGLEKALKNLNKVKPILDGITGLLKVVGRVITLFA